MNKSTKTEMESLAKFVASLVVKDEAAAEAGETLETSKASYDLISAVQGTDDNTEPARAALVSGYVERNPYYKHLQDVEGIRPYSARVAEDMAILKSDKVLLTPERSAYFLEQWTKCVRYWKAVLHTTAFMPQPLYPAFARVTVAIMAIQRYVNGSMDMASNVDFFEEYALRNLFASLGLGLYGDIPIRYQRRILKNINNLLRLKGTTKAIVDIVKLFGFTSIEVYKHFIVKDFPRDVNGQPEFGESWDSPNLRFVKVRHDATDVEEEFRQATGNSEEYNKFTAADPYWQATEEAVIFGIDPVTRARVQRVFNRVATKYVSIGSTMDLLRKTFELAYFKSMLTRLQLYGPSGSALDFLNLKVSPVPIDLYDAMVACQILVSRNIGYSDNIPTGPSSIQMLYAYSFDENGPVDTPDNEIARASGFDWKDVVDPADETGAIDIDRFVTLYTRNDKYRQSFKKALRGEQDYAVYKRLRQIYDIRFFSEFQASEFMGFTTYSDYLASRDPNLAKFVADASATEGSYVGALLELTTSMENYVSNGNSTVEPFLALESYLIDYIKLYIRQMVDIFKSYTTEIRQFTITYIVGNDPFDNAIHWRERRIIESELSKAEYNELDDGVGLAAGYFQRADGIPATDARHTTVKIREKDLAVITDTAAATSVLSSAEYAELSESTAFYGYALKSDGVQLSDSFNLQVIP
jgi:hypothetical protein